MSGSRRRQHILILTQYYDPDPNFITQGVAEHLAPHARVTVLTSHPNYPSGRFAEGFPFWRPQKKVGNGITVWRLPMVPDRSPSVVRRAISYLSFGIPAMIAAPLIAPGANVVWVYQTPFTTGLAGWYHKFVRQARMVFTTADLWPESFLSAGVVRPGWLMQMSFAFRRWMNRWADLIICSTMGTRAVFSSEGIADDTLAYVPIWVDGIPDTLPPVAAERNNTILYAGNLGPAQALDTLIRAAAKVRDELPSLSFELYGVGSESKSLKDLATSLGAINVSFRGSVPPEEAFSLAAASLAQVVSLRPNPLFRMTVPSKLIFSLAAGAPILAGLEGEAGDLARESGAAIPFDAASPDSLASALRSLVAKSDAARSEMGRRGQSFYLERFDRRRSLERYRDLLLDDGANSSR